MTQAEPTAPRASPEFTAPIGTLPVSKGAPKTPLTDTKLQPKDATITSSLWTMFTAKG
jgi:hypothetical protein